MNIKLRPFLICLFIIALVTHAIAEVDLTRLVKKTQPSIVTVITYDDKGKVKGQGSGFFINRKGHLITNYHVLRGSHSAGIKTYDGKVYSVKSVLAENEKMDLIKLSVDIREAPSDWLSVTPTLPAIAERIIVIGSPLGLTQTVSEGIVSGIRDVPNVGRFLQMSAPISPGSSGSPVVNMNGDVVGVATFYLVKGQNLNFAIPAQYLLDLKPLKTLKTIAEWTSGVDQKPIRKRPRKGRLFVHTEPEGARVRILNIKPKFNQGIIMKPGRYHIEVSATGYEKENEWIEIEPGKDKNITVSLKKLKPPVKEIPVDPNLDPPLPPAESVSFDDILKSAEEKRGKFEKAIEAWNKWQGNRNREFEKVKQIDKDPYINPEEKAEAWSRFFAVINTDNPFSNQDDDMRVYSQSRKSHWERRSDKDSGKANKSVDEKTDRDEKAEKSISGGWDLQLHIYRLIGPQGDTRSVDRQTQYTINLSQKDRFITGELLGAVRRKDDPDFDKGLSCGQADIKGEIQNPDEIVLIFTYTGNCCPGSQETIHGKIDADGNLVGDLKWVRTGTCIGAWATVVGTRRLKNAKNKPTPDQSIKSTLIITRDGHYMAYANGVVRDTKTGLEWVAGPDRDTNWDKAKRWVNSLTVGGGEWRMPSIDELESLYRKGRGTTNMTSLLKTTGLWVWSGQTSDSSMAYSFHFKSGKGIKNGRGGVYLGRAFAVRFHSVEDRRKFDRPKDHVRKVRDGYWDEKKNWHPPIYK